VRPAVFEGWIATGKDLCPVWHKAKWPLKTASEFRKRSRVACDNLSGHFEAQWRNPLSRLKSDHKSTIC